MTDTGNNLILYSPQADAVWDAVERTGTAFSKRLYVQRKYQESAPVFTTVYDAFVREAVNYVPRPEGAEYPYWAFPDVRETDGSGGGRLMTLRVPVEEVILFDRYDWYRLLQLGYLGESPEEEKAFDAKLKEYGVRQVSDVMLTAFYPALKRQVTDSWKKLFRHNEALKAEAVRLSGGKAEAPLTLREVRAVQAALWQIKKEWLIDG